MPVRVPFSKSTVFEICRRKIAVFVLAGRPIRHIFTAFKMCWDRVNAVLKHHLRFAVTDVTTYRMLQLGQIKVAHILSP